MCYKHLFSSDADKVLKVKNRGCIFIGSYSPISSSFVWTPFVTKGSSEMCLPDKIYNLTFTAPTYYLTHDQYTDTLPGVSSHMDRNICIH